ncbi:glycosyltransferase family 2 protein [Motilibacter deserti]|uniref:glycosyltransferase family 2 protein n=1 Tax=Motilibacter deserti TaxID=2714956 RepID=UPI002F2B885B
MESRDVDVILPCRDEAAALPRALRGLPQGWRPIVVDNGSRDGTAEVARRLGALVVSEPVPGYGAAVHAGLLAASRRWVATMDADGSMEGSDLARVAAAVLAGRADIGVGRRVPVHGRAWPWHARAGTALTAARLRRRGAPVHDIAPMRFAARETLLALGVADRRMGYPVELLRRAAEQGLRFSEVHIAYGPRASGTRSKVSGSLRGSVLAAVDFTAALR